MKKAVIKVAGKQYLVAEGDKVIVDLLDITGEFKPEVLMIVEEDKSKVGEPVVKGAEVVAKVISEEPIKGDKIRVIRYKAKKRVHKENGHRQKYSEIEIVSIK
jgi:large subunit ribosomal protein L21